ncbi:LysR family transcriptional regulator [Yinghuangia soli]|uniref:LysR family transcriptional regulator n=1 Tax=Yinghuangia soli TaxID=2908204 RepID=A0AA41U565_9ACTN|nr:LysR family transcriptional regulator [Yinghuangia soli]MCF2531572.1 LysR family transcriptional regulator [Yinghuangia soli]
MTLQQLRYLIAIVEHGSISAAAEALFTAQPAITRAVQSLERELKVQLLVRAQGRARLTPEGESVVLLAHRVLAGVAAIGEGRGRAAAAAAAAASRPVRLGTSPALAIQMISALSPRFARHLPGITVDVVTYGGREPVHEALRNGDIDVGLTDLPVPPDLEIDLIRPYEVVLVSPPDVDLPDPLPRHLLHGLRLIVPGRGSARRTDYDEFFAAEGVQPAVVLETDERAAWLTAVAGGLGSMLWYRELLAKFDAVVRMRSFDPPLHRSIGLATTRKPMRPEVRAFYRFARGISSSVVFDTDSGAGAGDGAGPAR